MEDPTVSLGSDSYNSQISLKANEDKLEASNGESCQEFGVRRRHRCFVVTARARSFLYHQLKISRRKIGQTSMLLSNEVAKKKKRTARDDELVCLGFNFPMRFVFHQTV